MTVKDLIQFNVRTETYISQWFIFDTGLYRLELAERFGRYEGFVRDNTTKYYIKEFLLQYDS